MNVGRLFKIAIKNKMSAEIENIEKMVDEKNCIEDASIVVAAAPTADVEDSKSAAELHEAKSNSETDSADESAVIEAKMKRSAPKKPRAEMPTGKYALVSVDVDTTGRRLIDEVNTSIS